MKTDYYVYIYYDPDTEKPFYVGKGRGFRSKFHITEAISYGKKPPVRYQNIQKIKRIIGILEKGKEPIIKKVFFGTDAECIAEEIRLIRLIGRSNRGGPLVNQTDGGDGTSGYKKTPEQCVEMSRIRKGRKGVPHTDEHKLKMKTYNKGGIVTRKVVLRIDLQGVVKETYESLTQFAKKNGSTKSNCSKLVKSGAFPRNGYFYRYDNSDDYIDGVILNADRLIEYANALSSGILSGRSVIRCDEALIEIEKYDTIRIANLSFPEIKYATLWSAIKYERICAGFYWKYAGRIFDDIDRSG